MTDIEKPEYAGIFPDKLANGINPLDNTPVAENELVNHVRISRCFFYVSDVLRQVIEERSAPKSNAQKRPFSVAETGIELGIYAETGSGLRGEYSVILYSRAAQEFLIEHFDAILADKQNSDE